jgi:predicted ATPase
MVKEIKIQNYKSVQDLSLELGRINVLIGANGCGKSNILEAIAFGSAAAEDKLGNEFLSARGIRVTDPRWMRSGFVDESKGKDITIDFEQYDGKYYEYDLSNDNKVYSKWKDTSMDEMLYEIQNIVKKILEGNEEILDGLNDDNNIKEKKIVEMVKGLMKILPLDKIPKEIFIGIVEPTLKKMIEEEAKNIQYRNFLIYAPENTFLRKFEEESQIQPLGIKGEGLFDLLHEMNENNFEQFQEIIENLELIDWFEGFEIPKDLVFTERRIRIKDRFLEEGLQYFDQRSSNEGFLFLMFYFALFISKYTPKFFAIDNIDASLNPKLCIELMKILTKLAKKHDKQVIFTTHNPAILDGLNLNDDEVRLLVVQRNIDGHTKVKRVKATPVPEGEIPVRLSEKFMRGYIGGLPKNF